MEWMLHFQKLGFGETDPSRRLGAELGFAGLLHAIIAKGGGTDSREIAKEAEAWVSFHIVEGREGDGDARAHVAEQTAKKLIRTVANVSTPVGERL